ncbi:MAG: alpha/beta hydrolase [Saprospiraceae bacterium]|nr:alpha/beta hydrolase [Saprospiraceae bacterium]
MHNNPIVIYAIGGLGADSRVFDYLTLNVNLFCIEQILPIADESIENYTGRISKQIDTNKKFGLLGVSFGGILALELNKYVDPLFTILISSVSKSEDLPKVRVLFRKIGLLEILPRFMLKPPSILLKYLFGAKNVSLLKDIIRDTDPEYIRWALKKMMEWKFESDVDKVHLIHGSQDRLLPNKSSDSIVIQGGGHFMIVDNADEISESIHSIVSQYIT